MHEILPQADQYTHRWIKVHLPAIRRESRRVELFAQRHISKEDATFFRRILRALVWEIV